MNRTQLLSSLAWLLKLGLGALFVLAGYLKMRDPTAFAEEIANYKLLPQLAPYLAMTLPTIELVIGATLIGCGLRSPWLQAGALAAMLMLGVFTLGFVHVLTEDIDISCGCFGTGSSEVSGWSIARNLSLIAAAAVVIGISRARAGLRTDAT